MTFTFPFSNRLLGMWSWLCLVMALVIGPSLAQQWAWYSLGRDALLFTLFGMGAALLIASTLRRELSSPPASLGMFQWLLTCGTAALLSAAVTWTALGWSNYPFPPFGLR